MYVFVKVGLYPVLFVYCLLLTTSFHPLNILSGVRVVLFCTYVLVERSVCVHVWVLHQRALFLSHLPLTPAPSQYSIAFYS